MSGNEETRLPIVSAWAVVWRNRILPARRRQMQSRLRISALLPAGRRTLHPRDKEIKVPGAVSPARFVNGVNISIRARHIGGTKKHHRPARPIVRVLLVLQPVVDKVFDLSRALCRRREPRRRRGIRQKIRQRSLRQRRHIRRAFVLAAVRRGSSIPLSRLVGAIARLVGATAVSAHELIRRQIALVVVLVLVLVLPRHVLPLERSQEWEK